MPSTGNRLMRKLIALRKGSGLETCHVAQRMGVETHAIYTLEHRIRAGRDVLLTTVVDYCRAIGVRLTYEVALTEEQLDRRMHEIDVMAERTADAQGER